MTDPHDERPYLAEWWPRVGATLLDLLIVWAIFIASRSLPRSPARPSAATGSAPRGWLVAAVIAIAYTAGR